MKYPINDIIAAPSEQEIEYRFDYTDENGQIEISTKIKAKYGLAFVLSLLLIFIRLYVSLFGRRMRNEGLRFHSIFLSIFNFFQVIFYANVAIDSPWKDYMRNVYITKHSLAIEQITFSAFPASVTFIVPCYILTYIFPKLRQTFIFKWFIWILIYTALTASAIYCLLDYKDSLNGEGSLPIDPLVGYYQFLACNLSTLLSMGLLSFILLGYLCTCTYAAVNLKNPDRSVLNQKMKDINSLFMITAYIWITAFISAPKNMINMTNFYLYHVTPYFQQSQRIRMPQENALESMNSMSKYMETFNTFLFYIPITELIFPIVEFFTASIFLQMYRESLINLLSCGVFYHNDSNGSIWRLLPNRYRTVQPLESTPFKFADEELGIKKESEKIVRFAPSNETIKIEPE